MASLQLNIPLVYTPFDSEVTDCFLGLMIFSFFVSLLLRMYIIVSRKYFLVMLYAFFPPWLLSTFYGLILIAVPMPESS